MNEERKTVEKPRSERSREPTDFIHIHMRVSLLHNGARRVIVPFGKLVGSFMREGRLGVLPREVLLLVSLQLLQETENMSNITCN